MSFKISYSGVRGKIVKESVEGLPTIVTVTSFAKSLKFNKENANISPSHGQLKTTVEYGLLNSLQQREGNLGNVKKEKIVGREQKQKYKTVLNSIIYITLL